ncbi:PrpF, AcnD-accessory [Mycolicibacterium neoaurum]|uniref:PrpF domain-containing protein n=1 Tax=Mycolicibacterium neoaurum TaxID=1795 RepID=UPI001BD05290|nr:PrpF domain-containing protein [Mycolicibacterium neoaurum]QVI25880.1 PrpF, AcnD-accessory [Mycolicibacterium neoaurum]
MTSLWGTWMRGGTSKCWLFNAVDVDPLLRNIDLDAVLIAAFGSEDPRQLDGVGGGTSTTSKAAIVRRSRLDDVDVDYLFAQVAIGRRAVEWGSNCGNCATAIGLYALQTGMVAAAPEMTVVRMRNQNTGARLSARIATPGGIIPADGDAAVPGTNARGVPVSLTFTDVAANPDNVLPTGSVTDVIDVGGHRYRGTFVNAGAPAALFRAADFDLTGVEGNDQLAERLPVLIELRRKAALAMGLAKPGDPVQHAVPKVGIIGAARDYVATDGMFIPAEAYDVAVRMVSMLAPHPAIGLTSAVAVSTAAAVRGSVVAEQLSGHLSGHAGTTLRLGTAAGIIPATVTTTDIGLPRDVSLHRAARRIARAELFLAESTPDYAMSAHRPNH